MRLRNVVWQCDQSRTAIQDMVVRGAPAIAIAAALALAVEVESLKPVSGTGLEAVTFLKNRLDYLVSRFIAISLRSTYQLPNVPSLEVFLQCVSLYANIMG